MLCFWGSVDVQYKEELFVAKSFGWSILFYFGLVVLRFLEDLISSSLCEG
jgi:hypothetical protein